MPQINYLTRILNDERFMNGCRFFCRNVWPDKRNGEAAVFSKEVVWEVCCGPALRREISSRVRGVQERFRRFILVKE